MARREHELEKILAARQGRRTVRNNMKVDRILDGDAELVGKQIPRPKTGAEREREFRYRPIVSQR